MDEDSIFIRLDCDGGAIVTVGDFRTELPVGHPICGRLYRVVMETLIAHLKQLEVRQDK